MREYAIERSLRVVEKTFSVLTGNSKKSLEEKQKDLAKGRKKKERKKNSSSLKISSEGEERGPNC